uniref:Uncharacterized protein n=1 Tax=Arundo donax TaxID=35708 RepID=A0A0A8ZFZ3_ARUDO
MLRFIPIKASPFTTYIEPKQSKNYKTSDAHEVATTSAKA